jgi:DNA (cytosine-5)-methyltransferase 1
MELETGTRATEKPPYRVPSMAEIRDYPKNGYKVASTFTGAGGSCLGFAMSGYETVYASEFVPAARDTYRANFPGVPVDERDIRTVRPEEILERIGLDRGELDVLEGSPPCASFSTAGKREKSWNKVKAYSDTAQRADDLFFEFARILDGLQPKAFVAENVSGLVKGSAKGYFKEILRALKGCGYNVVARLLDAQWLGVPQARQRIIFVGVREDLGIAPAFPSPYPYRYSIRDALPYIRRVVPTVQQHGNLYTRSELSVLDEVAITRFAIGKEWDKLKQGETSDKYFSLSKPHPDKPCPTVTQTGGNVGAAAVTHPTERRKFTIAELRRICSFPDDFVLTGAYSQQWERLGRSVPPLMMRAVAETVRDEILGKA